MTDGRPGNHGTMTDTCDHDWQTVNHDGNRDIVKCTKCGAVKSD